MTTVTIFCIGTDHDQREEYNILCVLHRLTVEEDGDRKFIYDGAPLDPQRAAEYLKEITKQAITGIESVGPTTVNLVGHSRGAANCLLIASRLWNDHPTTYECNLFLIDTVKYAPKIPEDEVRFIRSNVKDLVHVIMEDNTLFLFDLYEIKKHKNNLSPGTIRNIRIPGRHGTATQCNPIVPMNEKLKPLDDKYLATNLDREQLWPIGGLTLSLALQQLKTWGTKLHENGEMLATDDWQLFFYHRIEFVNPIVSKLTKKRRVNDTKFSRAEELQKSTNAPGRIMRRSELLKLRRFGKNPFRFNPIFINEHHVQLCKQKHGNDLIDAVMRALKTGKKNKQYRLKNAVIPGTEQTIIKAIKSSFYNDALFLKRLHAEGFVWSQDQLLYELLDR